MAQRIPSKKDRSSIGDRIGRFDDLAGRIDNAAVQKQSPQVQMQILQQKEMELKKAQEANKTQVAQLQQQYDQGVGDGMDPKALDEMKTEVDLALAAGQKLSHEIKNVQEMQMDAENKLRDELSRRATPTPGAS